jgi:hypothetical protein
MQSFFTPRPSIPKKTKLENTQELQAFIPLLAELKIKNDELITHINGSMAHAHYLKGLLVTTAVIQLDAIVNKFNASGDKNLHTSIFEFATSISELLQPYVTRHKNILNASRSQSKDMVRSAVNYASIVASACIGVIESGGSLIAGAVSTATLAPVINEKVSHLTGLSDMRADSFRIVEDLCMRANQILTNINISKEISNISDFESQTINGCLLLTDTTDSPHPASVDLSSHVIAEYDPLEISAETKLEELYNLPQHRG